MPTSNSGTRHVSLFVPELLSGLRFLKDIPKQDVPELPATQLLLSRATQKHGGFEDFHDGVCFLTGITSTKHQDLPIAAITVATENKLTSDSNLDYFIFAEPVVMKADRDSVVLLESLKPDLSLCGSSSDLSNKLTRTESETLVTEINQHFCDEPWKLHLTKNAAWYFILDSETSISTTNIAKVLLQNTKTFIPKGESARYWRKIINEIEMLLFASTVNAKRLEQNKTTVTSLWLWGGGKIPDKSNAENSDMIWGENDFLQSVALFVDIPFKFITQQSVTELIKVEDFKHVVIVNTILKKHWQQQDLYSWLKALKELELNLLEPLLNSLRKKRIDTLILYQDKKEYFRITRKNIKSWWKPVKSLKTLSELL
ncbi:MAG: hypothetical protein ACC653_09995 [Gammaproteobacteria bacterium]